MGGNALKSVNTVRLDAKEYRRLMANILWALQTAFSRQFIEVVAYSSKESFGDGDIIYNGNQLTKKDIDDLFVPNEIVMNGSVISFDVNSFQIDLINVKNIHYASRYFSYNDIAGNLVGKFAHKYGLKHSHEGLVLPLRNGTNLFDEVIVTTDYQKAVEFLGLSYERYEQGFTTLEEGFDWIASSENYHPDLYKLENLNNIAKTRDRKRATYHAFLQYGEKYKDKIVPHFHKDKSAYLPMIFSAFPEAKDDYSAKVAKMALHTLAKEKFNGEIVSTQTGLTGKELGQAMAALKRVPFFSDEYVVGASSEFISYQIEKYLKDFQIL